MGFKKDPGAAEAKEQSPRPNPNQIETMPGFPNRGRIRIQIARRKQKKNGDHCGIL